MSDSKTAIRINGILRKLAEEFRRETGISPVSEEGYDAFLFWIKSAFKP